jgi:uncharacterized protein (TIGR00369 family)
MKSEPMTAHVQQRADQDQRDSGDAALPAGLRLDSPFVKLLGMRLVGAADGASEVLLPLDPLHLNTWDVAHGGVTMTLLDVGMAVAARSVGGGAGVVTVEMKTNFMQPGRGELGATSRVLHRSTTMAYCEGEVRDSDGRLVAKALGTFKYIRALAVGRDVRQRRGAAPSEASDAAPRAPDE